MLRIHIDQEVESVTLRLEGRLAGAWVRELESCYHTQAAHSGNRRLVIELEEVTFVDAEGRLLLQQLSFAGAKLVGRGALSRHLVEEIQLATCEPRTQ